MHYKSILGFEHKRVVDRLNPEDVVYDMFAGIGPFVIPAAKKKKCTVFANDLNPESVKWLDRNAKLNKVKTEFHTFNMDGREFVKEIVKPDLLNRWKMREGVVPNYHILMNLPALGIEFLDVFPRLLSDIKIDSEEYCSVVMPKVYCYCFSKSEDPETDVKARAESILGQCLPESYIIHTVRSVAPNKDMMRITFNLNEDILIGQSDGEVPPSKRLKPEADHQVE